ncbi:MAG: hypothetical protein H6810_06865 [Phycisphaeraceae bacterium]|nr:MAG: hypothetical protein H6810_06865 [Phycisphaeraceae bacterium]
MRPLLIAGSAALVASVAAAGDPPIALYRFEGTLASTIPGAPAIQIDGPDSRGFSGGTWGWDEGTGLLLDVSGTTISDAWTIGLRFSFDDVSGWVKILDTQNRALDNGWYNSALANNLEFYPSSDGTQPFGSGDVVDVVVSFSNGVASGYLNGTLSSTSDGQFGFGGLSIDRLFRFFEDDNVTSHNEVSGGWVNAIVVWDRGLTAGEIGDLPPLSDYTPACTEADLAEPFGLLDLADILAFVEAFGAMDGAVDFDGNGLFDLADVLAFVTDFNAGCP